MTTILNELTESPEDTPNIKRVNDTIRLVGKLEGNVLDLGERNELTRRLEEHFKINIDSTTGDLDLGLNILSKLTYIPKYNHIIASHILEHLFNPMNLLLNLKTITYADSILHVFLPYRRFWIIDLSVKRGHFHEFTYESFHYLCERTGWKINKKILHKNWRPAKFYLTGFRPFLRLFLEWNVYYRLTKT